MRHLRRTARSRGTLVLRRDRHLHSTRAELLRRLGRPAEALTAYRAAPDL